MSTAADNFRKIRLYSERICAPLETEDYVVQPVEFVSPPKWHLGHTTWFFEEMILKRFKQSYEPYNREFAFVFNSYYEGLGKRILRTNRGNLTRPTVVDVLAYRQYVDRHMMALLDRLAMSAEQNTEFDQLVELGLQHEQQHQELLLMDIKYILGNNPLFPAYNDVIPYTHNTPAIESNGFIRVFEGIFEIGHKGKGFAFDNELGRHKTYTDTFHIAEELVTNGNFVEFIKAGGYTDHKLWTAEGLAWVRENNITAPMYWFIEEDGIQQYNFNGLGPIDMDNAVTHVSQHEARAYAKWVGKRLPTEAEWEIAAHLLPNKGKVWEHTSSAYLPYPGFKEFPGLAQEYNGKFMVNQMVLRGSCLLSPPGHVNRDTYRNFFHPDERWFMGGIRLAY